MQYMFPTIVVDYSNIKLWRTRVILEDDDESINEAVEMHELRFSSRRHAKLSKRLTRGNVMGESLVLVEGTHNRPIQLSKCAFHSNF